MKTVKFKTNIKCSGCVAQVTPFLNETAGKDNWSVDIEDAAKVLSVRAEEENVQDIIKAVEKAGYNAEEI